MIRWFCEGKVLPRIGETVLIASPRQSGEFWDIETARLMARHEDVIAKPVEPGTRWPTDYAWGRGRDARFGGAGVLLITGNTWWARLDKIQLPPGAVHREANGYPFVAQLGDVFIPQGRE